MRKTCKLTVRETRQRQRDGKTIETVRFDVTEPPDGWDPVLTISGEAPTGFKSGEDYTLTIER